MFSVDDLELDYNDDNDRHIATYDSNKLISPENNIQLLPLSNRVSASSLPPKRPYVSSVTELQERTPAKIKRRFPGPAGLLPDKPPRSFNDSSLALGLAEENVDENRSEPILCSQSSLTVFTDAPYQKMKLEFQLKASSPLAAFNIEWVRKKAVNKSLRRRKIPFLALVVQAVDSSFADPLVTLRDPTGELVGALHRQLWQDMGHKLKAGSAIALKQVSVTSGTQREVILNITMNNILTVYSQNEDEGVEITRVHPATPAELSQQIVEWQAKSLQDSSCRRSDSPSSSPNLFQTISSKRNCAYNSLTPARGRTEVPRCLVNPEMEKRNEARRNSKSLTEEGTKEFISDFDLFLDGEDFLNVVDENTPSSNQSSLENDTEPNSLACGDVFRKPASAGGACSSSRGNVVNDGSEPLNRSLSCSQRPLSQAENIIVNGVLSGVELDDFELDI